MGGELVRREGRGDFHFVTFSCFGRKPYLRSTKGRDLFENSLERMRVRYEFCVAGYVVMPEHVHLLVSEPREESLSTAIQALKLSVAVQSVQKPFWLARYYDFNVFTGHKPGGEALLHAPESGEPGVGGGTGGVAVVELSTLPDGGAGGGGD